MSDWSQEVYGDLRAHAVPGEPVSVRREYLNDYLQHPLVLATAGPTAIEPARSFLQAAYSPLANGAWPRETAWGWTMVPVDQMAAYISAQVDAMRFFTATSGQTQDHWGFAWAPRNTTGMSSADFATQTGQLLDRIAAAIRDSAEATDPVNSGTNACGPPGQDTLCLVDIPGASHNAAWQSFRTWTQPLLAIAPTTAERDGGHTVRRLHRLAHHDRGDPVSSGPALTVTLRASSPSGTLRDEPCRAVDDDAHALRGAGRSGHLLLPGHAGRCVHGHRVRNRRDRRHADRHRHGRLGRSRHDRVRTDRRPRASDSPLHGDRPGRLRKRRDLDDHLERRSARTREDHRDRTTRRRSPRGAIWEQGR